MATVLEIERFLAQSKGRNILDVRSPSEFSHGHIPGARNLILFNDEERAEIGTLYKKKGRQTAVIRGLDIVAPKLSVLVNEAKDAAVNGEIFVHCWRGGMRSGFVSVLLDMYGLKTFTLKGGYKKFRNHVLNGFTAPYKFYVLGGKTGSGKTFILKELKNSGQSVIDLESIAHHKGSSFGALGEAPQPTQEQFENELMMQLLEHGTEQRIWLEDESRMIGRNVIPPAMWENMRASKVFYLDIPFEERLSHILGVYGEYSKEELRSAIERIGRRLGPEQTKNALMALETDDLRTAFGYCLHYYDKTYAHGLTKREKPDVVSVPLERPDFAEAAAAIKKLI